MKHRLIQLLVLLLAMGACRQENGLKLETITKTVTDSISHRNIRYGVLDTDNRETAQACKVYNEEIRGLVEGMEAGFLEEARQAAEETSKDGLKARPWEIFIRDTVYRKDKEFISTLVTCYRMCGGANGTYNLYAINYNTGTQTFLQKKELFRPGKEEEINALLKKHLKDPEHVLTFAAPSLKNATAVNPGVQEIHFTFNKYILGPGYCGIVTISIPRSEMTELLK